MSTHSESIKSLISDLTERNKELKCLYQVDEILSNFDANTAEVMRKICEVIPHGMRFSDICKVQITYDNQNIASDDFETSPLKIQYDIATDTQTIGDLQVVYIKKIKSDKGIFLSEEKKLIQTIADKVGKFLLYKQLRSTINALENNQSKSGQLNNESNKVRQHLRSMHLSEEEIDQFLAVKISFKKGETICKQGTLTSYIMLIADGLSKNYLEGTQERGFNFKIVKQLDFIGLSSLYGSNLYQFSGSAITPCTVYMIDGNLMKNTIKNNPLFAESVMTWYCKTTEGHLKRLSCLGNKQSLGRLAEILLYLADEVFHSTLISREISRKDIAELAGMSTESAVRILSDLKKDNILRITNKGIEITDPKILKTISMAG